MITLSTPTPRGQARTLARIAGLLLLGVSLSACGAADRLANVGAAPALSPIEDPTASKGYKPVQMPMPTMEHASFAPNSLWRTGSRAFFKDQRARLVGDLVTVKVKVTDKAQLSNTVAVAQGELEPGNRALGRVRGGDERTDGLAHAGFVRLQALDALGQHVAGDDGGDEQAGDQRIGDESDRHATASAQFWPC